VTKAFRLHGERWRLAVFGECFNVFNIANLTFYNEVLNAPGFGEASQRRTTSNIFGTGGTAARVSTRQPHGSLSDFGCREENRNCDE
jgi:hypothetical protein